MAAIVAENPDAQVELDAALTALIGAVGPIPVQHLSKAPDGLIEDDDYPALLAETRAIVRWFTERCGVGTPRGDRAFRLAAMLHDVSVDGKILSPSKTIELMEGSGWAVDPGVFTAGFQNEAGSSVVVTSASVMAAAEALSPQSAIAEIDVMFGQLVAADLSPIEVEQVIQVMHRRTGIRVTVLREQLKDAKPRLKTVGPHRDWAGRCQRWASGEAKPNLFNIALAFREDPDWRGVLALNEFTGWITLRAAPPWKDGAGFEKRHLDRRGRAAGDSLCAASRYRRREERCGVRSRRSSGRGESVPSSKGLPRQLVLGW
jgi:hypothetical protein